MDVILFQHNKKVNSTLRPKEGSGTVYTGVLRDGCGILNPVISIRMGENSATAPRFMNYAYIEEFRRYYWISDWNFEGGLWTAYMRVDALASWVYYIEHTNFYVTRSSITQNESLCDELFPRVSTVFYRGKQGSNLFGASSISDGYFVLGIASKNASPGMISYLVMDSEQFNRFGSLLYSDEILSDLGDISENLARMICNPIDYIVSCRWHPFQPAVSGLTETVNVGYWDIRPKWTTGLPSILDFGSPSTFTQDIDLLKHPQAEAKGNYMNCPPFTALYLECEPWGTIEIDAAMFVNCDTLRLYCEVDCVDGSALLWLQGYENGVYRCTQYGGTATVGCPINVSGMMMSKTAMGLTAVAGNIYNGLGLNNVFGSPDFGAIGTNIAAVSGQSVIKGADGSINACLQGVALRCHFQSQAEVDNDHKGRPLCENHTPLELGTGYYLVLDGEVVAPCTESELQEIKRVVESGFFYEVNE